MKNYIWVIEWKNNDGKYIPIDYENTRRIVRNVLEKYKAINPKSVYRIRKYVSER